MSSTLHSPGKRFPNQVGQHWIGNVHTSHPWNTEWWKKTGNKVAAIWEVLEFILFIASQNKPKRTGPKLELQNVLFISTFALALEPEFGQLLSNSTRRLRWRLRLNPIFLVSCEKDLYGCLNTFYKQLKLISHYSFPLSAATTLIIFSARSQRSWRQWKEFSTLTLPWTCGVIFACGWR